jgi:hypothetical protein
MERLKKNVVPWFTVPSARTSLTLQGPPVSFSPRERVGIRSTQVVNSRSLNRHVMIKEDVFFLFPDCPKTSTNLANRNSLGVIKRLARPMAIGAKDHPVFLWINLLDYGCFLHPHPPAA